MRHFSTFFFLLLNTFLYSQEIKITVIDSLNQLPINDAMALNNEGQFISKSNEKGIVSINANRNDFIYIVANGYEQTQIPSKQTKDYSCKLIKKPETLNEVIINSKRKEIKYGNLNLNHSSLSTISMTFNGKFNYQVCANEIEIGAKITIQYYNFCISSKVNNSPFNFQIYSDKNGVPDQVIYTQYVTNYKKGWNRIAIADLNLALDSGVYYIAMQWIPKTDKSDVTIDEYNHKKYYYYGQILVMNKGNGKELNSYIYHYNKWDKWDDYTFRGGNFAQYIEGFEN